MIFGEEFNGWNSAKPFKQLFLQIANSDQLNLNWKILQDEPSPESAPGFAAHQPAANDSHAHF